MTTHVLREAEFHGHNCGCKKCASRRFQEAVQQCLRAFEKMSQELIAFSETIRLFDQEMRDIENKPEAMGRQNEG